MKPTPCFNCGTAPVIDIKILKIWCEKCGLRTGFKKKRMEDVLPADNIIYGLLVNLWNTLPERESTILKESNGLFKLSKEQISDILKRGYTYVQIGKDKIRKITKEDLVFLESELEKCGMLSQKKDKQ